MILLFQMPNSGVAFCHASIRPGETEEAGTERIAKRTAALNNWRYIGATTVEQLPPLSMQEAWTIDANKQLGFDMTKGRALKIAAIRRERGARLQATDAEYIRAFERQDPDLPAIKAKRQALRDLPQTLDLTIHTTPQALDAFQPEWPK